MSDWSSDVCSSDLEDRRGRGDLGRISDDAHAVEHEGDRTRLSQGAAVLAEGGAHLAGRAVAIVGQRLDDDGDAAGAVAFVAHLFIVGVVLAAGRTLDGPLDRKSTRLNSSH